MPLRRRKTEAPTPPPEGPPPEDLVRMFLRGQNLEQMKRFDEAIEMYEASVTGRFDAAGPYDRLIAIYRARNAHADVRRIADAALESVKTYDDKKAWYAGVSAGAIEAEASQPDPRGAEF